MHPLPDSADRVAWVLVWVLAPEEDRAAVAPRPDKEPEWEHLACGEVTWENRESYSCGKYRPVGEYSGYT